MEIVVIGNGILGISTAYELIKKDRKLKVTVVGPHRHPGCASLAAAAMFNSFCEVDAHTLNNKIEREKFLFNKSATAYWPPLLKEIQRQTKSPLNFGFGTFLINNTMSDGLEDQNFEAIIQALKEFNEPYQTINPAEIPFYKPSARARSTRAIYINNEGWVNPVHLINALKEILQASKQVEFVDASCQRVTLQGTRVSCIELDNGEKISGDCFFMAPGAVFSKIIQESKLGLSFPKIFYGVGCSILLNTKENTLKNCIRTPNRGLACGVYSAPQDAAHTLVGASNFISPVPEEHVRLTSVYTLLKAAMEQINSNYYRADLVKVNVGWRPTSEDTLPLIGKTSIPNLLIATGTKRDGLHCSPVISKHIVELILEGKSSETYPLFSPERKPVRCLSRKEAIASSVEQMINAAYQHDFQPAKNRMEEELRAYYEKDLNELHDRVGAIDWGIPPEMINMYKYDHIENQSSNAFKKAG